VWFLVECTIKTSVSEPKGSLEVKFQLTKEELGVLKTTIVESSFTEEENKINTNLAIIICEAMNKSNIAEMTSKKIYVGYVKENLVAALSGNAELFRSYIEPNTDTILKYYQIIGPFKTVRAAKLCQNHPNLYKTVREYERCAKVLTNQTELIEAAKR